MKKLVILVCLIGVILGFMPLIYAEEQVIEQKDSSMDNLLKGSEITIRPPKQQADVGLSQEDKRLADAIVKASQLTYYLKLDKMYLSEDFMYLLVKYARYQYTKDNIKEDFVLYIQNLINKYYSNSTNWIDYYQSFL